MDLLDYMVGFVLCCCCCSVTKSCLTLCNSMESKNKCPKKRTYSNSWNLQIVYVPWQMEFKFADGNKVAHQLSLRKGDYLD